MVGTAKVDWNISERARNIVKNYEEYTEHSESEVVNLFLLNLLDDEDFITWIEQKRNNRRIVKQLGIENLVGDEKIGNYRQKVRFKRNNLFEIVPLIFCELHFLKGK